jgi:hypothetical protein
MRHDFVAHFLVAFPAGAFGDEYVLVLVDDFCNARNVMVPSIASKIVVTVCM